LVRRISPENKSVATNTWRRPMRARLIGLGTQVENVKDPVNAGMKE